MKLTGARIQSFVSGYVAQPDPKLRAILLYGPDTGLVRERAAALGAAISPDLEDPFRVASMSTQALAGDPSRLHDEMAAMSLTGGRRLVRVRDAADSLGALFAEFLKAPAPGDSVAVVESGDLAGRSTLRRAFESAANAAAVPCYADTAKELGELVTSVLRSHHVAASAEARDYLVGHLGADRGLSRAELEKLALYAGDGGKVDLEDAVASVGDSAAITVEDAIFAAADGDAAALERALTRAFQEGESAIGIVRGAMRHFDRLHIAGAKIAAGLSPDEALRALRIFFKHQDRFLAQLRNWGPRRAAAALNLLLDAERQCKRTGFPDHTICSEVLLRLARGVRRR